MHAYVNRNGIVTIGANVLMSPTTMNAIVTDATTPIAYNGTLFGPRCEYEIKPTIITMMSPMEIINSFAITHASTQYADAWYDVLQGNTLQHTRSAVHCTQTR